MFRHWLLALVIAAHLVNSGLVIYHDRSPEFSDGADYYAWSVQVARALRDGDLAHAAEALLGNPQRAPLGILPAALVLAAGGPDAVLARLSTLLWLPLMLLSVYAIGARLESPRAGVLGAAVAAAIPSVMGFSRLLWLDFPLATMACVTVWMLLRPGCFRSWRGALALGAAVGLGMLVKPVLLLYVGPLGLGLLLVQLLRRGRRLLVLARAAVAGITALAVFGSWGLRHAEVILLAARKAQGKGVGSGEVRVLFDLERVVHYLTELPASILGLPLTVLAALALALLVWRDRRAVVLVSALWFWCSLLLLGFFVEWNRYLLPAVPAAAVVIGCGFFRAWEGLRSLRWVLPAACALLLLFAVQQSWFGPLLAPCERDPNMGRARIFCAGLLRSTGGLRARPDLRSLGVRRYGLGSLGGAVPNSFSPEPASPPYNMIGEALTEWLVSDVREPPWMGIFEDLKNRNLKILEGLKLVAVMEPGEGLSVPPHELASWRRVRTWLRKDPLRWRLEHHHRFTDGSRLRIYRNLRPRELPPPGDAEVW